MRAVLACALFLAACGVDDHAFPCERDDQCGAQGRCEAEGFCSRTDTSCADTGHRFVNSAPSELANQCVITCAASVYAGDNSTCARRTDGSVLCWGANGTGQLGIGSADEDAHVRPEPAAGIFDSKRFSAIALGGGHTCGIGTDGQVACWGKNVSSQVAEAASDVVLAPVSRGPANQIAAGRDHSCAVDGGSARCWGANDVGQLGGNDLGTVHTTAVTVLRYQGAPFVGVQRIASSAAGSFTCAEDSAVGCWGANEVGQLGDGGVSTRAYFEPLGTLAGGSSPLVAGRVHACVSQSDGVRCWGANPSGQVGNDMPTQHQTPTTVAAAGGSPAIALAAGHEHTCAIVDDALTCWGDNSAGQLGDGTLTGVPTSIAAGRGHTCVVVDQRVLCWGDNSAGQLGDGTTTPSTSPRVARLSCPR